MKLHRVFALRHEAHLIACIAFLRTNWQAFADKEPLVVEIRQRGDRRSVEQNKRHWAVLNDIAAQAWVGGKTYDAETWHEHMKRKFIGVEEIHLPDGTLIERGISTTTLSVPEFALLLQQIEAYAATELGVVFQ